MESVRQVQRSFYANETGISPPRHGIFSGLPIWTGNYTELPGFQHVTDSRDPEFINLMLKIVSAPRPWYFGHIFNEVSSDLTMTLKQFSKDKNDDPIIGTLMQISDYQLDNKDGKLRICVQALGRFCIIEGSSSSASSTTASVELLPDNEIVQAHYYDAKEAAASFDFALNQNTRGAACAGAVAEATEWHAYEFEPVTLGGRVDGVAKLNPSVESTMTGRNDAVHDAMEDYLSQPQSDVYEGECIINFSSDDGDNDVVVDDDTQRQQQKLATDQTFLLEREVWIQLDVISKL